MENFRNLLHRAQTAEVQGNHAEAMACLRQAAALCQQAGLEAKAQKIFRHLRRLEAHGPRLPVTPAALSPSVGPAGPTASVAPTPSEARDTPPQAQCVFCKGEAEGGWQGESGLWLCGACLRKALGAGEVGEP
ncbi:MAG: hypothetical protein FWC28_00110 [Proteobacteria bacterium]|nr:hypothetical protein [Cystobacterineae bacterium]MCL2313645.1 hypothetical protein [Pseudomonadota bacterium]